MQQANDSCDEEKFLLELYKFFKRSNFDGDEKEFEELIRNKRVHFYISNDDGSMTPSSMTTCENCDDPTESIPQDGASPCEQCVAENNLNTFGGVGEKDENANLRSMMKRRKNRKKLSNGFWRYLRCTLAPRN